MANGIKDRSKERRPGVLSNVIDSASSTYQNIEGSQKGKWGKLSYRTNLLNQLGSSLYGAIRGGEGFGNVGKSALEKSLFGIEFDVGGGGYIGAETGIERDQYAPPTRGFRLNIGKRF